LADVLDERARHVRVYVRGLGGLSVAAQVGSDGEMIAGELRELVADQRPLARVCVVQLDAVDMCECVRRLVRSTRLLWVGHRRSPQNN
jgi:hypothetical protein